MRDQPPRTLSRLAAGLQRLGIGGRLRRIQLRTLQLADLRIRSKAQRAAIAFAWIERPTDVDTAAWASADAAANAHPQALSEARIRP